MDVGALLVAGGQPFEGVQPGEAALDHPAAAAEPRAVGDAAAGDARGDAPGAQLAAVGVVVVAAVGEQLPPPTAGAATPAADRRHRVDHCTWSARTTSKESSVTSGVETSPTVNVTGTLSRLGQGPCLVERRCGDVDAAHAAGCDPFGEVDGDRFPARSRPRAVEAGTQMEREVGRRVRRRPPAVNLRYRVRLPVHVCTHTDMLVSQSA
jgi:hypothetical protein